jgi:16S rRNA (adenine1518-N6/adenine1519-N6)-dimethyltransferase
MSRQKMGQHFLGDAGWRKRILEALNPKPNETWVEIGPGHGEMTRHLTGDGRRVIAIEADTALATALNSEIEARPDEWRGVEIVTSDVLKADIGSIIGPRFGDATKTFRVYGSLPYYITSPILHHLFQWADRIASIDIVIQLEVAERTAANPGSRDYGYLSTICQFYTHPKIAFRIPPGAFRPPPKVQSALVKMTLPGEGPSLDIATPEKFFEFLGASFAQKRKTLRNNLVATSTDERIHEALQKAGVRSDARAEQLTLTQFATIFKSIYS